MRFADQYRLYSTRAPARFLKRQLREACPLYKAAQQERDDACKTCRQSIHSYDPANQSKAMRAEGLVDPANFSCCPDVRRRVTCQTFLARVQREERPGFPRYRPASRYDRITFRSCGGGCRLPDTGKLRIQVAGHLKIKLHRPVEGTIQTVTIQRDVNHCCACFSGERDLEPLPVSVSEIGIEVALDSFAVWSDGSEIDHPRQWQGRLAQLRRCQRKLARRKRGSRRRSKARVLLAKAQRKIRNQRSAFPPDLSRWLVARYGWVAMEDLNVKGLSRRRPARSIGDAGWSSLFTKLSQKAECAGREWGVVDQRGTSPVAPPCRRAWRIAGTMVARADGLVRVMSSALKEYSNAPR